MAIGVLKLTKSQRNVLSVVFMLLNSLQVTTGVIMLILSVYMYISVAPILYSERAEISYVFLVVGVSGLNTILCYLFGIKIRHKCLHQAHKKSSRSVVFAWSCLTFYLVAQLALLARHSRGVYKHVVRSMEHSLHIGMQRYLRDAAWKVTIDRLQFQLQCCGVRGHREWHQIGWLGPFELDAKAHAVEQFRNGSGVPVTPWSCCRLSFPLQCLHDPLQQLGAQAAWADHPSLVADSVNGEGCILKLKAPLRLALALFVLLVVANVLLQVLIFLVLRWLYTSCRNALLLGDGAGVAPGWIFGRGDFGYNRGKTLMEIMDGDRRVEEEEEEEAMLLAKEDS